MPANPKPKWDIELTDEAMVIRRPGRVAHVIFFDIFQPVSELKEDVFRELFRDYIEDVLKDIESTFIEKMRQNNG